MDVIGIKTNNAYSYGPTNSYCKMGYFMIYFTS